MKGAGLSSSGTWQQFVQMGDHKSNFMNISCVVSLGLVVGLKLFTLYIIDLQSVLQLLKFVLFADNTSGTQHNTAGNNLSLKNPQGMLMERESRYNLRGELSVKKSKCASSCGVTLCNSLQAEINQNTHIHLSKKRLKILQNKYMAEV